MLQPGHKVSWGIEISVNIVFIQTITNGDVSRH